MSIKKYDKIKKMFDLWPKQTIAPARWLVSQGLSYSNLERYEHSCWIEKVSPGAYIYQQDTVSWEGAVYGLQRQHEDAFFVGGKTAIELLGAAHYIPYHQNQVFIFSPQAKRAPNWLKKFGEAKGITFHCLQYAFLPNQLGVTTFDCGGFQIEISSRERAALEMIELLGRFHTFDECMLIFENLGSLRPTVIQELLEACTSIKAKRVFLFLAKQLGHKWFNDLDLTKVDLGKGVREITKNGKYDPEFKIMYPKGLFGDDKLEI